MKAIYKKNMPYFFSPADRVKYSADEMVDAYFGEKFHFSSNMFNENSPCACHHDTISDQPEFPSGITAMASLKKGETTRRTMRRGDGELCFVQYNHGDVVLMNPALYHGLLSLTKGPRYSLVLYNNRSTMKDPTGKMDINAASICKCCCFSGRRYLCTLEYLCNICLCSSSVVSC